MQAEVHIFYILWWNYGKNALFEALETKAQASGTWATVAHFSEKCHLTGRAREGRLLLRCQGDDWLLVSNHNQPITTTHCLIHKKKALVDKVLPDDLLYLSNTGCQFCEEKHFKYTCCSSLMHTHGRWSWNSRFKRNLVALENKCAQPGLRNPATT